MAMATGTALLIGAGISAATQLWGAHKASEASEEAAGQQVQASNEAMNVNRDVYNTQMSGMQPYTNIGNQAVGSLGALMGFTPTAAGGAAAWAPPAAQPTGGMAGGPVQPGSGVSTPRPSTSQEGAYAPPPNTSIYNPTSGPPPMGHMAAPGGGTFIQGHPSGQTMVTLRAPTGEVSQVPEAHAQHFIDLGATRI